MEFNKFMEKYFDPEDKFGFNEMIFERHKKIEAARARIKKDYLLNEEELDDLFKIVEKAEFDIEKVKRKYNEKDFVKIGMIPIQKKIVEEQEKMKKEFEKKLMKIIKAKYEKAKKIKKELDKRDSQQL